MTPDEDVDQVIAARLTELRTTLPRELATDQLALVRRRIGQTVGQAAALSAIVLTNDDEPATIFRPLRSEERQP
jgi:hypothetical protein